MNTWKIKNESGFMPQKKTEFAAGFDIYVGKEEGTTLLPHVPMKVGTGLFASIPEGFCGIIKMRSGFGAKGVIYLGSGLIDSDYRGELILCMMNLTNDPIALEEGERVCQMIILPVPDIEIIEVDNKEELGSTFRGEGGYGSTGIS